MKLFWEKTEYSICDIGAIDAPFFLGNKVEKVAECVKVKQHMNCKDRQYR